MIRRLFCALAALAVFAIGSVVWAQPAAAAPGGACSIEEWTQFGNAVDCARRLGNAVDVKVGCVAAPMPGSPTSGMPGWFAAQQPDSALRDGVHGAYSRYGTGGYGLDTYNLGCLQQMRPDVNSWNVAASAQFSFATSTMGAANALRERAYDPGTAWGWSDGFLEQATTTIYRYVFSVVGALSLVGLGLFLIWQARQGNLSQTVQLTAWALFVLLATTGLAKWPVQAAHATDASAASLLSGIHSLLGPSPQHIPANECVLGGEACIDSRPASVRASDIAVHTVIYKPWLRAMLGDEDSVTAQKYGLALYDATTLSWGEAARADQSPELRKQLLDAKAQSFVTIAAQIQNEDPQAYEHLQGMHGSDRMGAGFIALLSTVVFAVFDVTASLIILLGFGIFRYAIIAFPLLATIGVFRPAAGPLRRVLSMSASSFVNIVVFGAGAGLYLTAVTVIFGLDMPGFVKILVVGLTAVIMLMILRPDRRFVHIVTGRSQPGRLARRMRRGAAAAIAPVSPAPAGPREIAPEPEATRPETEATTPRRGRRRAAAAETAAETPRPETADTAAPRKPSPRPRAEQRS